MLTTATSTDRNTKRDRERRARQRRRAKLHQMRHLCDALECAVVVSQTFDDVDAVWEDFLDDHALRVRHFLRQSLRLTKEAHALQVECAILASLLAEHRLASQALAELLSESSVDDWERNVARWRVFSRTRFKRWTLDNCNREMEVALKEVNAFEWSPEKETSGLSLLGWREQRRMDQERNVFQYQFYKTFRGNEMMNYVNIGWDTYTDPKTFREVVTGYDEPYFHEVLQQLGPNTTIIWVARRLPQIETDVHMTFLVCRVQTKRGVIQCVRSITCPELIDAVDGGSDKWASTFAWQQWTRLGEGETGYKFELGGSIIGKDRGYLSHWMIGIFGCVLRGERLATGRKLLRTD